MSRLTLQKSFFDRLWPLILSDNVCDTYSKNKCKFYDPDQRFDDVWVHGYLAGRGFKNYQPPTVIRCCFDENERKLSLCEIRDEKSEEWGKSDVDIKASIEESQHSENASEEFDTVKGPHYLTLDEQINAANNSFDTRRKLAHAFINRQYPWYMQQPTYETPFQLTDTMRQMFTSRLEKAVLQDMHTFNCKLVLIDLVKQICLHELRDWLNFTRYAFVIVVARSEDAVKQIKLMGPNLSAAMVLENMEYTWHDQLSESLRVGLVHASNIGVFENCTRSFIFVFARRRNSCKLNMHRVLRKNT
ncbi:uncharacterized protein LOC101452032 [Ceratitis capitata]|uniref:Uncharacterized protein n=2 Tax=Ceratitis capitata TaxID=7213 RepID=W8C4K2_CERCA|nr:uncharacterized protein LOC101452032 [Ceratitis capitata]